MLCREVWKPIRESGFVPWLEACKVSEDLVLSSCAARTLLHLDNGQFSPGGDGDCTGNTKPPVFSDGIHLFDPRSKQHQMLARGPHAGTGRSWVKVGRAVRTSVLYLASMLGILVEL